MIEDVKNVVLQNSNIVIAPHYNGNHSSIVYTYQGHLYLKETVDEVMNQICIYFCSDLQGRINGTRKKYDFRKKPPILISEFLPQVAIPYPSHIAGEDMWVFNANFKIEEVEKSKSKIIFDNQLSFDIARNRDTIEKQRLRAIRILYDITYGDRLVGHGKGNVDRTFVASR